MVGLALGAWGFPGARSGSSRGQLWICRRFKAPRTKLLKLRIQVRIEYLETNSFKDPIESLCLRVFSVVIRPSTFLFLYTKTFYRQSSKRNGKSSLITLFSPSIVL